MTSLISNALFTFSIHSFVFLQFALEYFDENEKIDEEKQDERASNLNDTLIRD